MHGRHDTSTFRAAPLPRQMRQQLILRLRKRIKRNIFFRGYLAELCSFQMHVCFHKHVFIVT